MKNFFLFLFLCGALTIVAQPAATTATNLQDAWAKKEQMAAQSRVKNMPFTNIGPTVMSGRVVGFAVNPENPTEFYVGYASGGVWHTTNNGTTFTPILDNSPTQNVGALAMHWPTRTLWVGTGEVNSSRSSYAGIGLLKTTDNGANWAFKGLPDSHHISSILIHPDNPEEVVVGVVGHLYSPNKERGIYKTTDGGTTWKQTLFINEDTGIIEVMAAPENYNIMYAAAWEKDRKAWNFKGNGAASGLYKSTDAGNTWQLISTPDSGFPTGEGVGRIGLAVYNGQTLYAIHDSQFRRDASTPKKKKGEQLEKNDFKTMTKEAFLALDTKQLERFLRSNGFPAKYTSKTVMQKVKEGAAKPNDLALYLEDANALLFDTPVVGAEVYKSTDGGKTWAKTHEGYLDGVYFSYGYYFGKIHVSPANQEAIYIYGVPILKSKDGGKTFTSISAENVHADHHALWINPKNPSHLIDGNDGGINISYDDGANWIKNNSPSVGQFYSVNVDLEEPYNVYGGLQDNGVWVGPSTHNESKSWHQSGQYAYEAIMGGDGMQVQIDARNTDIVYTGYQFGNYFRLNRATQAQAYIQPKHELGESPYRFNWQTPILLSQHNQDILYLGGNKLMRSLNQGDNWQAISPDLTTGGKPGNVAYGTITSISESPFQFGMLYVGSDDGLVHFTNNAGGSWKKISDSFPKDLWVSRVVASAHKKGRVYVSLNGYRWDDFSPYLYVSDDYGSTWKALHQSLPASPINVIKEDPHNPALLYVGTDNGVYASLDGGMSWDVFAGGLPEVAVHDLVIQPKANDLVLGTHGRSFYKTNVSLLQEVAGKTEAALVLQTPQNLKSSRRWGSSWSPWLPAFEPTANISFYNSKKGTAKVQVTHSSGVVVFEKTIDADAGVNAISYDVSISKDGLKNLKKQKISVYPAQNGKVYLPKGTYTIAVSAQGQSQTTAWEIQ